MTQQSYSSSVAGSARRCAATPGGFRRSVRSSCCSAFLAYATWAAFQNANYEFGPYLSPFYSPLLFGDSPHALVPERATAGCPPISPALLILPFPAGFRFTCYYYRGTYYKAFWADPPGCAVGEPRNELSRREDAAARAPERAPLLPVLRAALPARPRATTRGRASGSPTRRAWSASASASARSCSTTNVVLLGGYTLGCHSLRHLVGGYLDRLAGRPVRRKAYDCVSCLNRGHMNWAWASLFWVAFTDVYVRLCAMGVWTRLAAAVSEHTRRWTTTCSSSAPGALACARRSRRRRADVSVGVVCKSLLGKAHTVMAEGGMAAAMGNVDDRDSWRVHFADTMRGGQYLNNWRMAELHAQGSAGARARAGGVGRAVRPHEGRPHPAAQLRRPPLSAARARRRPHRARDDPHAAGSRHPRGDGRAHGVHRASRCCTTASGSRARWRTTASAGGSRCFARRPWCWPRAASAAPTASRSNSWEYTGDGHALAYLAGAALQDMEFVQFHPTGMIWPPSVRGILVTGGRARRGRRAAQQRRQAVHVRQHPRQLQAADGRQRGGGLALHAGRQGRPPPARAAHARPRGAHDRARGEGGTRLAARRRFLDISWIKERLPNGARAHQEEAPEHVPPVQAARGHRHHEGADGDRPDDALRHGRHPRRRRYADVHRAGAVRLRRVRGRTARREPARRQLAVRPAGVRQARRRVRGGVRARRTATVTRGRRARSTTRSAARSRRSTAAAPAKGRTRCRSRCRRRCRTSSASCGRSTRWSRRSSSSRR